VATQVEIGSEGGRVVLKITLPDPDGLTAEVVTVPLTLDEARSVVNGLMETIKFLSGSGLSSL